MRKSIFFKLVSFSVATIFLNCTNENDETISTKNEKSVIATIKKRKSIDCHQEQHNSPTNKRTFCCISGPIEAAPNDTIQFEYSHDLVGNPDFTWEVLSGKLILIEIQNATTATFKLEKSFQGGRIRAWGGSDLTECSELVEISLKKE